MRTISLGDKLFLKFSSALIVDSNKWMYLSKIKSSIFYLKKNSSFTSKKVLLSYFLKILKNCYQMLHFNVSFYTIFSKREKDLMKSS